MFFFRWFPLVLCSGILEAKTRSTHSRHHWDCWSSVLEKKKLPWKGKGSIRMAQGANCMLDVEGVQMYRVLWTFPYLSGGMLFRMVLLKGYRLSVNQSSIFFGKRGVHSTKLSIVEVCINSMPFGTSSNCMTLSKFHQTHNNTALCENRSRFVTDSATCSLGLNHCLCLSRLLKHIHEDFQYFLTCFRTV